MTDLKSKDSASTGQGALNAEAAKAQKLNWFLFVVGFLGIATSVLWYSLCSTGRPWEMAIATGAAVIVMLMGRLDAFVLIKAGGVEFQLREATNRAEHAAEEAYATVKQLRGAIEALSRVSLHAIAVQGFWGGGAPLAFRLKVRNEIAGHLTALGVDHAALTKLTAPTDYVAKHLHLKKIIDAVDHADVDADNTSARAELKSALSLMEDWETQTIVPAEVVRKTVAKYGFASSEMEQMLLDLEYVEQNSELRRPEKWNKSNA